MLAKVRSGAIIGLGRAIVEVEMPRIDYEKLADSRLEGHSKKL